jgi:hypothetical protein
LDGDFWDLTILPKRDGDVGHPNGTLDILMLNLFSDFLYTMGAMTFVMFLSRFLLFHLSESPKFLLSRGRQAEAVAVVHGMRYSYHKTCLKSEHYLVAEILNLL